MRETKSEIGSPRSDGCYWAWSSSTVYSLTTSKRLNDAQVQRTATMDAIFNLHDFAARAREILDPGVLAWLDGGALDEITLGENEQSFLRRRVLPRVLVDVSAIDTATTLLGVRSAMPVGIAPTAQHRLFHPDGELATARAAAAAGVPFVLSTMSSLTLEEVAQAGGQLWFQLYVRRPVPPESLIERAEAAGYQALVLTVDAPVLGLRERDVHAGGAPAFHHANLPPDHRMDPSLNWSDVARLRATAAMPLVIKGVLTADDARRSIDHGARAVWISNHGGRQLDRVPAAIDVLEEIVRAVDGRAEVYVDGGVRRGLDALIAVALGARAVFLGRPALWALAVDGEAGVRQCLGMVEAELRNAMTLIGARAVSEITREMVV